ncbi:hypothetical protein [Acinetobacter pittii]|uniref:hypothetical protein n=1 Tax=Acinetobacter pittii TaxID=48296 RepID=UPI002A74F6EF|nr:hypothetical protein [Acinetobacter pittii]WPP87179.1 hypothetical protein SOI77_12385 [Acinetobacter pittii]
MKSELKNFLIKICDWVFGLTAIFFIVVFIIFKFDKVSTPFKEALSVSISFLSALATLGAAIIAARLFQTWKTQHSYVEQIKILSQMIQCINEMLIHLEAARQNDNLVKILLGLDFDKNINEYFSEQQKNAKLFELSLLNLAQLENQIYLLNNDRKDQPIFKNDSNGSCPLTNLLGFSNLLKLDIYKVYEYLLEDLDSTGHLTFKFFDPNVEEIQYLILNILHEGDMVLRIAAPSSFKTDSHSINTQLSKWVNALTVQIMTYRNTLDTLD